MLNRCPEPMSSYKTVFFPLPHRSLLRITGPDRFTWLQGMVTNDIRLLAQGGRHLRACVLDNTGHMRSDVDLVNAGEAVLMDLDRDQCETVRQVLESFLIMEECEIEDLSDSWSSFAIQGNSIPTSVHQLVHESAVAIPLDVTGLGGLIAWCPTDDLASLKERLLGMRLVKISDSCSEALRISAGYPRFGVDMDTRTLPPEAGLETTHISYHKGCYVGQEIIARLQSRGHTNRTLVRLSVTGQPSELPIVLTTSDEGREVGRITSLAEMNGEAVALGAVRHEVSEPGTVLTVIGQTENGTVTVLGPALSAASAG